MYAPIKDGTIFDVQGLPCWLPPKGYLRNPETGKYEHWGIHRRQTRNELTHWERDKRWDKVKQWEAEEKDRRRKDPKFVHADLEAFKKEAWYHRLAGYWFSNNGAPTFITGAHWYYLSCFVLDTGLPKYRDMDRQYFYFWEYCLEDPDCFGLVEVTKRRTGKSFRAGCLALYYATFNESYNVGIQSKTDDDAEAMFKKTILTPFRKLPSFFQPKTKLAQSNRMNGSELRFETGKASWTQGEELGGLIDYRSSVVDAYDGQKLHLYIGDEVGKTKKIDVNERWGVVEFCLKDEEGHLIGKTIHTTTVEKMDSGGGTFKEMYKDSDQMNKVGKRTKSGMYRFFVPGDLVRCVDKYGFADRDRAQEEMNAERKAKQGDPRALSALKRKDPFNIEEAFASDASQCRFNPEALNQRLADIVWDKPLYRVGNFMWKNGVRDTEAVFVEVANGRFQLLEEPPVEKRNLCRRTGNAATPLNTINYCAGADPFDHRRTSKTSEGHLSDASLVIVKKRNEMATAGELEHQNAPVCLYLTRPDAPEIFYEDCIMALHYYGCEVLIETQKTKLMDYMEDRGYINYAHWLAGKSYRGIAASSYNTANMTLTLDQYLVDYVNKICFPALLEQLLVFDPEKTQESDAVMAFGYALQLYTNLYEKRRDESGSNAPEVDTIMSWCGIPTPMDNTGSTLRDMLEVLG